MKMGRCEGKTGRRNDFMTAGGNEGWRDRRREEGKLRNCESEKGKKGQRRGEDGKMLCLRKKFYWGESGGEIFERKGRKGAKDAKEKGGLKG